MIPPFLSDSFFLFFFCFSLVFLLFFSCFSFVFLLFSFWFLLSFSILLARSILNLQSLLCSFFFFFDGTVLTHSDPWLEPFADSPWTEIRTCLSFLFFSFLVHSSSSLLQFNPQALTVLLPSVNVGIIFVAADLEEERIMKSPILPSGKETQWIITQCVPFPWDHPAWAFFSKLVCCACHWLCLGDCFDFLRQGFEFCDNPLPLPSIGTWWATSPGRPWALC